jgi:hypothetical protein
MKMRGEKMRKIMGKREEEIRRIMGSLIRRFDYNYCTGVKGRMG